MANRDKSKSHGFENLFRDAEESVPEHKGSGEEERLVILESGEVCGTSERGGGNAQAQGDQPQKIFDKDGSRVPCPERVVEQIYPLPMRGGGEWMPDLEFVREMLLVHQIEELYLIKMFLKMRGWLISNPHRMKTKRGMKTFVNNWISRQLDNFNVQLSEKIKRDAENEEKNSFKSRMLDTDW